MAKFSAAKGLSKAWQYLQCEGKFKHHIRTFGSCEVKSAHPVPAHYDVKLVPVQCEEGEEICYYIA